MEEITIVCIVRYRRRNFHKQTGTVWFDSDPRDPQSFGCSVVLPLDDYERVKSKFKIGNRIYLTLNKSRLSRRNKK